ncbi:hypothetical protein BVRB_6g136210 [Beta vulgaris subsp. vulgaris]|uniref:uncharacterized protein LOC104895764 isoform X2 n=1 Tax=Beta vulgaris subsp. vulgaris TaxID=3555 RepID=UPI00053F6BF3|nr:uncharacterized protein LOC104895764 isoform X2 [Beta vulgaris subsp. vulgaris]KMT08901.1 hypothetical protein BVRB_6g136210 [Beta vulgaris subsp. vulgaris]
MNAISMAKSEDESKSDGLEILSIGALFSGTNWDKKYWSSSRGKDRYPYPVGYKALRTHKGLMYKMEIHEGSKGPIFQITSNDKHFGSGETPDRAWESFQKKYSRIKLWHGKRFSGKIDGVELFGFKNALVQRLLRELVATVNDASDQSSVVTNCNEASSKGHDVGYLLRDELPDLRVALKKAIVTGKRSRTCRRNDIKSARESGHERCPPPHQGDDAKVLDPAAGKTNSDEPLIYSALSNGQAQGALQVLPNIEPGENVPTVPLSAHGLPVKSHEFPVDPKSDPCCIQVQSELPSMETCVSASLLAVDMPQEEKPEEALHISQLDIQRLEVQGIGLPVAIKEGNQKVQVLPILLEPKPPLLRDSEVNHHGDLYAPDTLDTQEEITCAPNIGSHGGEQATARNKLVADLVYSEDTITGSHSEEGSFYLNGNSEKSDFDSFDEDITKSMMKVLLPRAIPLLKYSSRKRRRRNELHKDFSGAPKPEHNLIEAIPSADVEPPARVLACSGSDGQIKSHLASDFVDSSASKMENVRYVVPDSLDNDQYEDHVVNELPPSSDNTEAVPATLQKENHEPPDRKGSPSVLDATESSSYLNETTGVKKIFPREELDKIFDGMPQNVCVSALHSALPFPSSVPLGLLAKSEDQCLIADGNSKPIENSSKNTDQDIMPECKGHGFIPIPGKKQSSPPNTLSKMDKYGAPLSESITCREYGEDCVPEMHHRSRNLVSPNSFLVSAFGDSDSSKASFTAGRPEGQISIMQNDNVEDLALNFTLNNNDMQYIDGRNFHVRYPEAYVAKGKIEQQDFDSVYLSPHQERGTSQNCTSNNKEDEAEVHASCLEKHELNDAIGVMKLIGCYSHLKRISSVMLTRKPQSIFICVSCGLLEERARDLFLYELSTKEPCLGTPYMVGHTSMSLPILKDEFGREIAVDKSGLQFTPDARGLVLADSIRIPYCREKNLHCLCRQCESCCFEENAVKIVQVNLGYVSLVVKLKSMFPIHCVLVCEPEHLIAVDESGRIYIWIMNSTWSVQTEEYVIPSYDYLSSRVVELKRIPKSTSMVIGHNGYGEFSLWNIIKRTVISRFSAPASSVFDFLPVSLFSWLSKGLSHDFMEECTRKLEEATLSWFSRISEANNFCPIEGEDVAVWLLIFTSSDSHAQSACYSSNYLNSDGCWRLGLLIKGKVILGGTLYSSTTAIGTSSGTGIIGTREGQVYAWELASGSKLEASQDLEGNGVSHIATDDLTSSAVAIAGDGGQLCIYLHT